LAANRRPLTGPDNLLRTVYLEIDCFVWSGSIDSPRLLFYHLDQRRQLYVLSEDWSEWEACALDTANSDLSMGMLPAPLDAHNGRLGSGAGILYCDMNTQGSTLYELLLDYERRSYR